VPPPNLGREPNIPRGTGSVGFSDSLTATPPSVIKTTNNRKGNQMKITAMDQALTLLIALAVYGWLGSLMFNLKFEVISIWIC
jgi:hypothetical protein